MASIFSKIINGDIPSHKIAEDDDCYAFLDINPLAIGHTLVVPKIEVDYIFDLDDDTLVRLHLFAKKVARVLDSIIDCQRVGVLVIGTEVPHAHIHLIPFTSESQMAITSDRVVQSGEEMKVLADHLSNAYLNRYVHNNSEQKTLVFGASTKPERYSNKAMVMLKEYGHDIVAIGGRASQWEDVDILEGHPALADIDTITMYMGAARQAEHMDYLLSLAPRRIIFNPGAENPALAAIAKDRGIEVLNACTLVMLRTDQY